jgi:hypothetical protein
MNRVTIAVTLLLAVSATAAERQAPQAAPVPSQQNTAGTASPQANSPQATNDAFVQQIRKQIAGHEQEPAEKVFKNIKIEVLKATPASRFVTIMDRGYSRALGVACTHCHDEKDFSSDEKRPKRAAREMAAMHRSINEQLNKMQNLQPKPNGTFINCSTCHRGAVDPTATTQ